MRSRVALFLIVAGACSSAQSGPLRPDPKLTPGVATTITTAELCSKSFHTRDERLVTAAMKKQVYESYGVTPGEGICASKPNANTGRPEACEVDHLISIELGGSNDVKNLWPQPYTQHPGAHEKDKLENWLHRQVCAGNMTLAEAQHSIASDWFATYQKMLAAAPARKRLSRKKVATR